MCCKFRTTGVITSRLKINGCLKVEYRNPGTKLVFTEQSHMKVPIRNETKLIGKTLQRISFKSFKDAKPIIKAFYPPKIRCYTYT